MKKCNKTKGDRQTNLTTQEVFKNKPENKQDKTSQTVTKNIIKESMTEQYKCLCR